MFSYAKVQKLYNTDNQIVKFILLNLRQSLTKRGKQFHEYDENLVKCIYQNVDLGGKIKMEGTKTSDNNGYRFVGKDGSYKFIIETHEDEGGIQIGYAYDGPKTLSVKLESF